VQRTDEIDVALRAAIQANAQGVFIMEDPMIESHRLRIAEFTLQQRLPAIGEFRPMAVAGALMSYGPPQVDLWRRAASYVDKILKGAKPADLPVEQPIKYELVINLKTAKAFGLTVPADLLVFADEVIQ
jgi:putative ABC transport system substrate-binding protein